MWDKFAHIGRNYMIMRSSQTYCLHNQVKAAWLIAHFHIERSCYRPFFTTTINLKSLPHSTLPNELFHSRRLAMKIDDNRAVGCKKRFKHFMIKSLRVVCIFL